MKPYLFNQPAPMLKTYKSNHDQGSGSIDAESGRITPVRHWGNYWAWWGLRHGRLGGLTPSFVVAKERHYNPAAGARLAVWGQAADSDAWTDFDNLEIGASDIVFSHATPFPGGKIYLAALPMYPFSRTARLVGEWRQEARVSSPASAEECVIGYATARDAGDGSGRTAPALPFYALKLSSGGANPKNQAILTAYNHPSETQGPFALEGAVGWLLGGSPEADFLLDYCDFFIYPCLNPQGVACGYFRSCPEDATLDHNRQWLSAETLECIDAFKAAMLADTGGVIEIGIDFHGWMDSWAVKGYSYDKTAGLVPAFRTAMLALDGAYDTVSDATVETRLETLWKNTYSAPLAITQEMGGDVTRSVADWKAYGANSAKALSKLLAEGRLTHGPGVGSRDCNGTSDRIDWASPWNPTASPITLSAWIYPDGTISATKYILNMNNAAGAFGVLLAVVGTNAFQLLRDGATDLYRPTASNAYTPGNWIHLLATHDGTFTDATAIKLYVNGVEAAYAAGANGVSEADISGTWSLGGRTADDLRNFDGKIAQVGVWERALTPAEIAALAAGYAPDRAASSGLKFYFKGNTESLTAVPGGEGTADGTAQLSGVGAGPAVVY